ncbi:MAG: hypothetical protein C0468_07600 [Planctomyces sp.]|nr:hypothetical protein [Planctomyces sp.]
MHARMTNRSPARAPARTHAAIAPALALAALALTACASPGPTALDFDPADYPAFFQAARDTLADDGYRIDRVDAASGVIISEPTGTRVVEIDDVLNRHLRTVSVRFLPAPADAPPTPSPALATLSPATAPTPALAPAPPAPALTAQEAAALGLPMRMELAVAVERAQIPGWRPSPAGALTATRTADPALEARGLQPGHSSPVRQDTATAARLVRLILRRAAPAPTPTPAAPR